VGENAASRQTHIALHFGYGIKGWYGVKRYALRMQSVSETAHERVKILDFWKRHGLSATIDAFGVSRRTLYAWQRMYRAAQSRAHALNNKGRAPLRRRGKRAWDAGGVRAPVAAARPDARHWA